MHVHQQLGALALGTNASNNQTITFDINGTNVVRTLVTSLGSTAGSVKIQASAALTAAAVLNSLINPQLTNSNQLADTAGNIQLLAYLGFSLPSGGTTITLWSPNNSTYAPLTSFSCSTTVTSGSYTGNTMALFIEPGKYWINGSRYVFTGGSTSTFTAPVSNPRIDVVSIDSSGTINITAGSESGSPSVPAYPKNQIILAEVYHAVGETFIYDNNYQQAGQGYINNDVREFLQSIFTPSALPYALVPDSSGGRDLGTSGTPWGNLYATTIYQNGSPIAAARFGGTGADGALTITSGTTTLSASSTTSLIKNYISISITGSGQLAFSNPGTNGTMIMLRSQGGVTLTSSANPNIDGTAMGGAGGGGGAVSNPGSAGTSGFIITGTSTNAGQGGPSNSGSIPGATANMGATVLQQLSLYSKFYRIFTGGGGGGGGGATQTSITGGGGGAGAGCLIIECAGALNLTATVAASVAGKNGTQGTDPGGSPYTGAGGGGGGAGGTLLILYNTLTANSGGISYTGGTGGRGGNPLSGAGGTGGAAGNGTSGNGEGGGGGAWSGSSSGAGAGGSGGGSDSGLSNGSTGGTGSASSGVAGGGGGGGASGYGLVAANVYFS